MDWQYHTAKWQEKADDNGGVRCLLCPRRCVIPMGDAGACRIRRNSGGTLVAMSYGYPVILQVTKMERKHLSHYLPGTRTFGIGGFGCSLGCTDCAEANFSHGDFNPHASYPYYSPEMLAELAKRHKCESIIFACNEASVWAEYAIDCAEEARKAGLGSAIITNGFIEESSAREILPHFEAVSVVFKGFQEKSYQALGASLQTICRTCEIACHECGRHVELNFQIIPGNASSGSNPEPFFEWAMKQFGPEIPLHFTQTKETAESGETPDQLCKAASEHGFTRVYAEMI